MPSSRRVRSCRPEISTRPSASSWCTIASPCSRPIAASGRPTPSPALSTFSPAPSCALWPGRKRQRSTSRCPTCGAPLSTCSSAGHRSSPTTPSDRPAAPPSTPRSCPTAAAWTSDSTSTPPPSTIPCSCRDAWSTPSTPLSMPQASTADVTTAADVLRANDRGAFTVPNGSLYPFQWLWDASFIALGWSTIDRSRAWDELDSVVLGQWPDGMMPHVLYHHPSALYFPDPDIWDVGRTPPTSGITQPPVMASAVMGVVDAA